MVAEHAVLNPALRTLSASRTPSSGQIGQMPGPFRRPSWDLHPGRTRRHPRGGDACDRWVITQEPVGDVGGHMALHDVVRDERDMAGRDGGGTPRLRRKEARSSTCFVVTGYPWRRR